MISDTINTNLYKDKYYKLEYEKLSIEDITTASIKTEHITSFSEITNSKKETNYLIEGK